MAVLQQLIRDSKWTQKQVWEPLERAQGCKSKFPFIIIYEALRSMHFLSLVVDTVKPISG